MALFEETEEEKIDPKVEGKEPRAYPEVYRGIAIDTNYTPRSSMLAWITGSNWNGTYYSQVLDETQEPTPLSLAREPAYQYYRKLIGVDIKINQPITAQSSEDIRKFTVTVNGHTYPSLTANYGDMWIAGVGDGRAGLFTVTSARRETYLKDSTYAIELKMVGWATTAEIANLDLKSIQTFYWSSSNLGAGCNPWLTDQEYQDGIEFDRVRNELIRRYVGDFFSERHSTFIVPDQLYTTYDHFLVKGMQLMLPTSVHRNLRRVKVLNVQSEPIMNQPTIWDALIRQDVTRFCGNTERAHLVNTRISRWRPELQAIGYSGIGFFVYPIGTPTDIDSSYNGSQWCRPEGIPFSEGQERRPKTGECPKSQAERDEPWFKRVAPEMQQGVEPWKIPADIKPVVVDDYYVFSEAFYYQDSKLQSKLESLTWAMIECKPMNKDQLRTIIKCCFSWDNLERFYYHPVLIALLGYSKRKV